MDTETIAVSIPVVAIVMGVGIGMLGLWLDYRKKREIFELHHKERMAAIEKGMEVPALPPELFQSHRVRRHSDYLRRGVLLLLVGLAITAAIFVQNRAASLWGLIPAAVGLAQVIYYYLGREQADDNGRPRDTDRSA